MNTYTKKGQNLNKENPFIIHLNEKQSLQNWIICQVMFPNCRTIVPSGQYWSEGLLLCGKERLKGYLIEIKGIQWGLSGIEKELYRSARPCRETPTQERRVERVCIIGTTKCKEAENRAEIWSSRVKGLGYFNAVKIHSQQSGKMLSLC